MNTRRIKFLGFLSGTLLTLGLLATPAQAHKRHVVHHKKVHHVHAAHRNAVVVAAPARIVRTRVPAYRRYRVGRAWHAGHGHYHAVYDFPVRRAGAVVVRPHHYCDDSLFRVAIGTDGFRLSIRF